METISEKKVIGDDDRKLTVEVEKTRNGKYHMSIIAYVWHENKGPAQAMADEIQEAIQDILWPPEVVEA